MNKKMRILIVGCGYFGQKRIHACQRLNKHITIVGIVDIDMSVAKKNGELLHVPYASSITNILKTTAADAAIIAIPNKYHTAAACEAIKNGLHVLCEKPLTTSVSDAKKIIMYSKKYNRFVKTGSNHRYFPTIKKASKLVKQGKIGNVLYIKGDIGTNGSHTKKSWFWDKNIAGGGTYIDNAPHILDIARWFMGDFETCVGTTANTYWKHAEVEDVASGTYKTKDNRLAVITSSWTKWVGYVSLEIWGDKGYIVINSESGNILRYGTNTSNKQKVYDFSKKPLSSYDEELSDFIKSVQEGIEPKPNAVDGARVIQMIEGVYQSAKQNKRIRLSPTL